MLQPDTIPQQEPLLMVGIVLPEDRKDNIEVHIPTEPLFILMNEVGETIDLQPGDLVRVFAREGSLWASINENERTCGTIFYIKPAVRKYPIYTRSGIRVKDVVSGRDFHWRKFIDVYLPGALEFRIHDDRIILINEVPMEYYLMCVATSEMGASCPDALIESQTIVARSWMLANVEMKHRKLGMDVCNDDCCQRYQGTTFLTSHSIQGARSTTGKVLIFNDRICDARYSKSCGGVAEDYRHVWDKTEVPYLQSRPDFPAGYTHRALPLNSEEQVSLWVNSIPKAFCGPYFIRDEELGHYLGSVDEEGEYFRWTFMYTQNEMKALLNLKLDLNAEKILAIIPMARGCSGRLTKVKIEYLKRRNLRAEHIIDDQYNIRAAFHELFLYSSAFVVETEPGPNDIPKTFTLKGAGWGHGVGYCQIGALGMALAGYTTEDIVRHYYPGANLVTIY